MRRCRADVRTQEWLADRQIEATNEVSPAFTASSQRFNMGMPRAAWTELSRFDEDVLIGSDDCASAA